MPPTVILVALTLKFHNAAGKVNLHQRVRYIQIYKQA